MGKIIRQIPNLFTLLNLVAGTTAIVFSFEKKFHYGCYLIGLALIFDFLDGFFARLLKAESAVGKQLDSLADIVSFGVAPAIFLYQLSKLVYVKTCFSCLISPGLTEFLILGSGFLIAVFAAIRLAMFNIDSEQKRSFRGLPTPAVAFFVSSLPLIAFKYENTIYSEIVLNHWFLTATAIFLSLMMVVRMPMFSFKVQGFGIKENLVRYIFILVSVVLLFLLHYLAVPLIILIYILLSGINHLVIKNN